MITKNKTFTSINTKIRRKLKKLIKKVRDYQTKEDVVLIKEAFKFADQAHCDQIPQHHCLPRPVGSP